MATEMSTTAPDMSIASDLHTLSLTPSNKTLSAAVLAKITTQKCATLHAKLQSTYSWPALPATVGGETAATENTLLAKIDEAVKDSGETDTLAAHEKLAEFYSETINVDKAMERYKIILEVSKRENIKAVIARAIIACHRRACHSLTLCPPHPLPP